MREIQIDPLMVDPAGFYPFSASQELIDKIRSTTNFAKNIFDTIHNKISPVATPKNNNDEISVEFTEDPILLKQFYQLREDVYRKESGWKDYDGSENEYDRKGKILVAIKNNEVVGGARLSFSDRVELLSTEQPENNFLYREIIKLADSNPRNNYIFTEISSMAIKDGFRDNTIFTKLTKEMVNYSIKMKYDYVVGVSYPELCRCYKFIFRKCGDRFKIFTNIVWPISTKHCGPNFKHKINNPIILKLLKEH